MSLARLPQPGEPVFYLPMGGNANLRVERVDLAGRRLLISSTRGDQWVSFDAPGLRSMAPHHGMLGTVWEVQ